MRKSKFLLLMMSLMVVFALSAAGCKSNSSSDKGEGTLALYLTDAATENYKAVYVSIGEVYVHAKGDSELEDGWQIVATPNKTYNLLELVNGVMEELGVTDLETGSYSQLRMILSKTPDNGDNILGIKHKYPNYIITSDDEEIPLKVPSGYQTGIKLVSGFDIIKGQTLELVLDFDASRSVVKAGMSGKYLLKPTIKVIESMNNPYVEGWVTNKEGGIQGAIVSAQIFYPQENGAGETVEVYTSTLTDERGFYLMYLPSGEYNIVAYRSPGEASGPAFGPGCEWIDASGNLGYEADFVLEENVTGSLDVRVTLEEGQTVSISALKSAQCNGQETEIEVAHMGLGSDENGQSVIDINGVMVLPVGKYTIVAKTQEIEFVKTVVIKETTKLVVFDFTS